MHQSAPLFLIALQIYGSRLRQACHKMPDTDIKFSFFAKIQTGT